MQSVISKTWGALDGLLTEGTQQFSVCKNARVYLGVLISGMCDTSKKKAVDSINEFVTSFCWSSAKLQFPHRKGVQNHQLISTLESKNESRMLLPGQSHKVKVALSL